jgi:hypothetical protein
MKSILQIGLLPALFTLFLGACDPGNDKDVTPPETAVNPAFENAPPIANSVDLQVLDKPINGMNVRFTASFAPKQLDSLFHAVLVGEDKIVLRDDGKGGDEKANDGVFSVLLKEDLDLLGKEMGNTLQLAEGFLKDQKTLLRFSGRTAEAFDLDQKLLPLIRENKLRPGLRLPLDIFGGGSLAPADPLLKDHSLMITDLSVVEDPTRTFNPCSNIGNPVGVWTFGHLMREMANGSMSVEDFTRAWLAEWLTNANVNSDVINARTQLLSTVISPWIIRSGGTGPITLANWQSKPLDVNQSPFKLTAIVNRMDLGGNSGYGRSNAGEGRFVFSLVRCSGSLSTAQPFNIIFEYGLPMKRCDVIKQYAQDWINLKTMPIGSPAYNAALETITNVFTKANANPGKVNGSALNQLRTNEIALTGPWELREFVLDPSSRTLESATVKQEPAKIYNRLASATAANQALLASWVNGNEAAVVNTTHSVPLLLGGGQPFLGGKAHTQTPLHFWDAAVAAGPDHITNNEARHKFSLTTCSGCHGGEADTRKGGFIGSVPDFAHPDFVHVAFVPFGVKATLSGFLIGDPNDALGLFRVNDPSGRGPNHGFNDLEDRARKLEQTAAILCIFRPNRSLELARVLKFKPIAMMEH